MNKFDQYGRGTNIFCEQPISSTRKKCDANSLHCLGVCPDVMQY